MPNAFQLAGAQSPPSEFAPLYTSSIFSGLITNRNPISEGTVPAVYAKLGYGRNDSIMAGLNTEISSHLTLVRRPGLSVYNAHVFGPITRFYAFNTFTTVNESVQVLADAGNTIYNATNGAQTVVFQKSVASPTFFLGVGNMLFFTDGTDNKQWDYTNGVVYNWGIPVPTVAPTVTQSAKPNPYATWQANTAYETHSPARTGMIIADNAQTTAPSAGTFQIIPVTGGGNLAIGCGENLANGAAIPLPSGFNTTNLRVWSTPCNGFASKDIDGVYASSASGGVVSSTFQNRSGGVAVNASSNWIAVAWDAAAAAHVTVTASAGFTEIVVPTAAGSIAFVIGNAATGATVPLPAGGFTWTNSFSTLGMSGTVISNNALQAVSINTLVNGVLTNQYSDGRGDFWTGTSAVFSFLWLASASISVAAVTGGSAVTMTLGAGQVVSLVFANGLANAAGYGLPAGLNSTNTSFTSAMTGGSGGGDNDGQGWNVTTGGLTVSSYFRDGSGHQWNGSANCFAVGGTGVITSGSFQFFSGNGTVGAAQPSPWNETLGGTTVDSPTVTWTNIGPVGRLPNHNYKLGDVVMGSVASPTGTPNQMYICTTPGVSSSSGAINWLAGYQVQVFDGSVVWTCQGRVLTWNDIGPSTNITSASTILDPNGYTQAVGSGGKTADVEPDWQEEDGALTTDGEMVWVNTGNYSAGATGSTQYGYAYQNPITGDISEMSPASVVITLGAGAQITVQGPGSSDPTNTNVIIYRYEQGGSIFVYDATVPNPGAGNTWTFIDTNTDAQLNIEIQAQVLGEGTPLPAGASCLAYHCGRIWAAVGNVIYGSSGPDAVVSTSSGRSGFNLTFTVQSKITRFWVTPIGMIIFTVRDSYILLGNGVPNSISGGIPFFVQTYIENLPLLNYDAFTTYMTTGYMFTGQHMLVALNPGAGAIEMGQPIAEMLNRINPATAYLTYHSQVSQDTALYIGDGVGQWLRMATTTAPETGFNWSPPAQITGGMSCLQSVETSPGYYQLLVGPQVSGEILCRSLTTHADNGVFYAANATFGVLTLAHSSQLAGLMWMTLESALTANNNPPGLAVLLDELYGTPENVPRTRQDPPNLPLPKSFRSDRFSLLQNQKPVWCHHLIFEVSWPAQPTADELLSFSIFGETANELRTQ
jgi:hypothetical protein